MIQPAGHGEDLPSPAGHERGPGPAEPQHPPGFQPALQEEGREAAHAADIPAQQDEGEYAGVHEQLPAVGGGLRGIHAVRIALAMPKSLTNHKALVSISRHQC